MSSSFRSKWFSMDALPGPVTNSRRCSPTRVSSSTTYCTTGLRPTGSISFGCDLVAGSRRVPRPATGTTAMSMSMDGAQYHGQPHLHAAHALGLGPPRYTQRTMSTRSWIGAGLPDGAYDSLANGLPASRLWSLLLDVARARAARRRLQDVVGQWQRDRFVQPSIVDQRALVEIDRHLLAAAADFDAFELSPVAPLGVCSLMGRASQNKVLSALRGTEVVADPTNVMALECARRLKKDASAAVRLATSHRC